MVNPGTGVQIIKSPQSVEETVYGSIPESSPTFNWIGGVSPLNPTLDPDGQDVMIVAYEDPQAVLPGDFKYAMDITVYPQSSTFLKYGILPQGSGSGSIDKSLTILWSYSLSGTENFYFFSGARIDTLKLKGQTGKPLTADISLKGSAFTGPTSSNPLTTPTYATNPGTAFWNFKDGGSSNVLIGGSWYDTQSIEVDFARNLKEIWTMQQANPQYIIPANRKITGTIKNLHEVNTNITALESLSEQTLTWDLKAATSTLTLNNVSFRKLTDLSFKADDVTYESYSFESRGGTIT